MSTRELMRIAEVRRRFEVGEAKVLRIAAGLTVGEAAKAANVSPTSLWRYENGQRTPRPAQALEYARFLEQLERGLKK
jgi:transcriptional regulator with XRE-family HTH domain